MADRFPRGATVQIKAEYRDNSNALSDPSGTPTVTIYDTDGSTALVSAASMTKSDTGIYTYNYDTSASSNLGSFKAQMSATDTAGTVIQWYEFVLYDPLTVVTGWSVDGLCAHLRGVIDAQPDAPAYVPDRIREAVRNLGDSLWNMCDWRFRLKQGTLSIDSGDTTEDMPTDFAKLDSRVMHTDDESDYRFVWTEDASLWQQAKDLYYEDSDTGEPAFAVLYWNETGGIWTARFCPEADDTYTMDYWYLTRSPWRRASIVNDQAVISDSYWPETFDRGWKLACEAEILRNYRRDNTWKDAKSEFDKWLTDQRAELNETIARATEEIEDVIQDFAHTTRGTMCRWPNLPGWPGSWYGTT